MDAFLKACNREVVPIAGDGFCFINSVTTALKKDHRLHLSEKEAIQLVLEKIIEDHDRYVGYLKFVPEHHEFPTNSDELVTQALDFF